MKLDRIVTCIINEDIGELKKIKDLYPASEYNLWATYAIAVINSKYDQKTAMAQFEVIISAPNVTSTLKNWCQFGKAEIYRIGQEGAKPKYKFATEIYSKLLEQKNHTNEFKELVRNSLDSIITRMKNERVPKKFCDKYIYSIVDIEELPECKETFKQLTPTPEENLTPRISLPGKSSEIEEIDLTSISSEKTGKNPPPMKFEELIETIKRLPPDRIKTLQMKVSGHQGSLSLLEKILSQNSSEEKTRKRSSIAFEEINLTDQNENTDTKKARR